MMMIFPCIPCGKRFGYLCRMKPIIISASISGAIHLQQRYLLALITDQTNVARLVITELLVSLVFVFKQMELKIV